LLPDDVRMVMLLPPRAHYVNQHPYCFNLWETVDHDFGSEGTAMPRTHEDGRMAM
jgi:hypothetical protein